MQAQQYRTPSIISYSQYTITGRILQVGFAVLDTEKLQRYDDSMGDVFVPGDDDEASPEEIKKLEDGVFDTVEDSGVLDADAEPESDIVEEDTMPADAASTFPVYLLYLPYSNETVLAAWRDGAKASASAGKELAVGDWVFVPVRYGKDLARVRKIYPQGRKVQRLAWIDRPALEADVKKSEANKAAEEEAFRICKEKIAEHGLDMKLIRSHYLLDESKIVFFFTSDFRVDFRELVKDLVSVFHTRIELRQIGIRDETRISGGLGHCGREFCCHAICGKMKPVSIKMAKEQGLSLNSMKISGQCGRLLCCLSYEYQFYAENRKFFPPEGCRINYQDTVWKVTESNMLIGIVSLSAEDGRTLRLPKNRFEKANGRWEIANAQKAAPAIA
jgi:cell fate regulator YaaT (PSP1 superfamily)